MNELSSLFGHKNIYDKFSKIKMETKLSYLRETYFETIPHLIFRNMYHCKIILLPDFDLIIFSNKIKMYMEK